MRKHSNPGRFVIALFILLIITTSSAQTVLSGVVIDSATGAPVPFANISISNTERGTFCDDEGHFRIAVEIDDELVISHIGYAPKNLALTMETLSLTEIELVRRPLLGDAVFVEATRGRSGTTPVAFTTLSQQDLKGAGTSEVPINLRRAPGIYAFSDAGSGSGYTYLKIRGFDQDRIGVLLNGIPLNDPEAHQVYWLDHGDLLSSGSSIQIQRGVGNSLYGTSTIGGSVNMVTSPVSAAPGITITTGYGDFTDGEIVSPTWKATAQLSRVASADWPLSLYGRFSHLESDGYRIGSGTDQDAVHMIGEYRQPRSTTRLEILAGTQTTNFAWDGIYPLYGISLNDRAARRYNYYSDPALNGGYTDANKDVFSQIITSFQHAQLVGEDVLSLTIYQIGGVGYYENYDGTVSVADYNLTGLFPDTVQVPGLLRRKWLDNGYWGIIPQYSHRTAQLHSILGADVRFYNADHFGRVVSIDNLVMDEEIEYYRYRTDKTSISLYLHEIMNISPTVNLMFDLKYSGHLYHFEQQSIGAFAPAYDYRIVNNFLDPRFGIRYQFNEQVAVFINASQATREPAAGDIYDADDPEAIPAFAGALDRHTGLERPLVRPEQLLDFEVGLEYRSKTRSLTLNLYEMQFRNELIPISYRTISDDGVPIHGNAPLTVHKGVEIDWEQIWSRRLKLEGSATLAINQFVDYETFEWQENDGAGGVVNHKGARIPGHPESLGWVRATQTGRWAGFWVEGLYTGTIYLDRQNTYEAAIAPTVVANLGMDVHLNRAGPGIQAELSLKVVNLLDTLYETFGYNYWDSDENGDPVRVDVYWPGATRSYYVELKFVL